MNPKFILLETLDNEKILLNLQRCLCIWQSENSIYKNRVYVSFTEKDKLSIDLSDNDIEKLQNSFENRYSDDTQVSDSILVLKVLSMDDDVNELHIHSKDIFAIKSFKSRYIMIRTTHYSYYTGNTAYVDHIIESPDEIMNLISKEVKKKIK